MASVVLKMSVSLDGYVAAAEPSGDWVAAGRSPDGAEWVLDTVSSAVTHLIGAETYKEWSSFWPDAAGPFAQSMNEIPKVVFSNSLTTTDWGPTTIARGDLTASVMRLKQEHPDGYLLAQGGVRFARSLVHAGTDRRIPACHPPGHPRRRRAALHRTAQRRTSEHHSLQPRSRRPRLQRTPVIEIQAQL